jgi:hypothetical protein
MDYYQIQEHQICEFRAKILTFDTLSMKFKSINNMESSNAKIDE